MSDLNHYLKQIEKNQQAAPVEGEDRIKIILDIPADRQEEYLEELRSVKARLAAKAADTFLPTGIPAPAKQHPNQPKGV